MTHVSNKDSLDEGFVRAAQEVIANPAERSKVIAGQDFEGLKQKLDKAPAITQFTQPMAEFYLGIPRARFNKLRAEHGDPFVSSATRPRSISKTSLLTWYAKVAKKSSGIQGRISGRFGRDKGGAPFFVLENPAGEIDCVISQVGITNLGHRAISDFFKNGAAIVALTIDQALALPWINQKEKDLWRNAYRAHLKEVYLAHIALLDRQELDDATAAAAETKPDSPIDDLI